MAYPVHLFDNAIPVIQTDLAIHTPDNPFCIRLDCLCHYDAELIASFNQAYEDGLISLEEAWLIVRGLMPL